MQYYVWLSLTRDLLEFTIWVKWVSQFDKKNGKKLCDTQGPNQLTLIQAETCSLQCPFFPPKTAPIKCLLLAKKSTAKSKSNSLLEWTFSASAIFETVFDLWKGIEQVLQFFFFFQSIYRLKCWYLSEWQLVLSWQFFSWLWSFYIVSKRKPVVVDWILQANTNRQMLKGMFF